MTGAIAGLVLGLLGSMHCIGMCGPIALSLPVHRHNGFVKLILILSYNTGRIITYTVFGVIAGLAGETLLLATSGRVLSITAGILVIFSVIMILPAGRKLPVLPAFRNLSGALADILGGRKKQGLFMIGLLNGLLPCGLVYMALTAAVAQGSIVEGAVVMAAFGVGTLPVMMAVPFAGSLISLRFRRAARRTVPYFVALTGILLVLRGLGLGIPYISPSFEKTGIACHQIIDTEPKNTDIQCTGHPSALSK